MEQEKRMRGRPLLPDSQRKRSNVTMRLRDALRQKLQEYADKSGRSLSEEMEYRLERSFLMDDVAEFLRWELSTVVDEA